MLPRDVEGIELMELTRSELEEVRGGAVPAILQYALFFSATFKAGFYFGYSEIGPALFGE